MASGLFWLSYIPVDGTFWGECRARDDADWLLAMGATFVSVTIAATSGVPHHESGLASGIRNTAQQVGGALGLAVLTGIATSTATRYLQDLHASPTAHYIAAASVQGYHDGYLIASGFAVIAALIGLTVIRTQTAKTRPLHPEPVVAL